MQSLYAPDELKTLPIAKLKSLAAERGIELAPGTDKRVKDNWVTLLTEVNAGTVTAEEFATFEFPASEPAETVEMQALILSAIDATAIAEQSAILSNDQESARCLGETVDRLLEQYQSLIDLSIENLAADFSDCLGTADILWASPFIGSVSVDGGNSYRVFRVLEAATDCPVVKVQTSSGVEIDSRWKTTAANRYIKAVLDALPGRIEDLEAAMFTDCQIVKAAHYSTEDTPAGEGPPIRGDGRGRISNEHQDWPYDIDCGF